MLCVSLQAGSGAVLGEGLYTLYPCIYVEMDKDRVFLTTAVLLTIKYSVVASGDPLWTGLQAWLG